jgi:RNA polymerase sigma factor (sigma-70 family)
LNVSTTAQGRGLEGALPNASLELASDERLVTLTRRGLDPAFEAIVRRHQPSLLRYSSRFLGPERAEDAVQQAFVKALIAMRADDRAIRLKPWLFRIVHNESLNAALRNGSNHEQLDESFDGVPQPPDVLARTERLREVVSEISSLPARQRSAVVLREFEGRSYAEIAAELGATAPIVRQLLHRARTRLRDACGALLPVDAIRTWFEAVSSPSGAAMAKLGTAAVLTGAIAGGAAVGVPAVRSGHDSAGPTAAATPVQGVSPGAAETGSSPVAPAHGVAPVTRGGHRPSGSGLEQASLPAAGTGSGEREQPEDTQAAHERPRPSHHGSDGGSSEGDPVEVAGGESQPLEQNAPQQPEAGGDGSGSGDGTSGDPASGDGGSESEAATPGTEPSP